MSSEWLDPLPNPFDVIVVGAGAAGLYATLCLPSNLKIGLISKDPLTVSASDWAQGGIAAAIAPDDSPQLHVTDTLKAGAGLCDPEAVTFLAEHAPQAIRSLLEMGVAFDQKEGVLAMTLEAAHSRRRVLHAADTTGRAIVGTLAAQVLARSHIQILAQALVLKLWLTTEAGETIPRCQGVCLFYQGQVRWIQARAVVLATGGGGQIFAQTTNPAGSTGDGVAIAWRSGIVLQDLEFVQFHPTALTKPGAPHFLISEAVRGEGAYLVDRDGQRFAFDYHPEGELAPRDVVSRAIFLHLEKRSAANYLLSALSDPEVGLTQRENQVWLDLRPIPPDRIQYRFPNIIQVCQQWGVDVFHEPIPVAPAAHYWMGGIKTDLQCRTSIAGVYAIGETASTGVHGANRLASNSLLECLVFASQLEQIELPECDQTFAASDPPMAIPVDWDAHRRVIDSIQTTLPLLVWHSAGICRERSVMEQAIAQIEQWQAVYNALPLTQAIQTLRPGHSLAIENPDSDLRHWCEVGNLLDVSYLVLKSALFRTESRGGHYRIDYPDTDPHWQVHTLVQGDRWWAE